MSPLKIALICIGSLIMLGLLNLSYFGQVIIICIGGWLGSELYHSTTISMVERETKIMKDHLRNKLT